MNREEMKIAVGFIENFTKISLNSTAIDDDGFSLPSKAKWQVIAVR